MVILDDRFEDVHHCSAAPMRLDLSDSLVVEHERANAVAVLQNPPRAQRGSFGGSDRFHGPAAAEEHVDALIDSENRWPVSLFREDSHERLSHSRRCFPVDRANVVTGKIGTHLLEVETPAAN